MNSEEYIKNAVRTESCNFPKIKERLSNSFQLRTLHGTLGIVTEAGELADQIKKFVFYNNDLDVTNIKEEMGDVFWYLAVLCHNLNITSEEIFETNIEKLKSRYPEKFTKEKALKRDLDKERKILEK